MNHLHQTPVGMIDAAELRAELEPLLDDLTQLENDRQTEFVIGLRRGLTIAILAIGHVQRRELGACGQDAKELEGSEVVKEDHS